MKHIEAFSKMLREIGLQKANGDMTIMSVDAFLAENQVPIYLKGISENPVRLIVPEAEVRWYDWYCKPDDEYGYMQYAKAVGEDVIYSASKMLLSEKTKRTKSEKEYGKYSERITHTWSAQIQKQVSFYAKHWLWNR